MVNNAGASISQAIMRKGVDFLSLLLLLLLISPQDKSIWASEEADEAFPLLDLLLNLVAGGGDLSLSGEDSADEGEHGAAHGRVEGPAHGAEPGPVRSRVVTAVQLDLV